MKTLYSYPKAILSAHWMHWEITSRNIKDFGCGYLASFLFMHQAYNYIIVRYPIFTEYII
jgi:hypothetical protein